MELSSGTIWQPRRVDRASVTAGVWTASDDTDTARMEVQLLRDGAVTSDGTDLPNICDTKQNLTFSVVLLFTKKEDRDLSLGYILEEKVMTFFALSIHQ